MLSGYLGLFNDFNKESPMQRLHGWILLCTRNYSPCSPEAEAPGMWQLTVTFSFILDLILTVIYSHT